MSRQVETVGILPWVGEDQHQINFANALELKGYKVERIVYKKGLPLYDAYKKNVDILILDWVHSFYISHSILVSILKSTLQFLDRLLIKKRAFPIIWNMHNLHRHDRKFIKLEKYNFKKLGSCVDGIRVFNEYSISEVRQYLDLPDTCPIINIPQGEYSYKRNDVQSLKIDFGCNEQDFVLLFFGSLREGKGIDKFIKTFREIQDDSLKLIIAGKPVNVDLAKEIKRLVKNDLRILLLDYFIDDDKIHSLFEISNVLVLPYEHISNSGVQILAHSFSKPVIANDIPVFRKTLNPNYAEFFQLNNSNSLLEALQRFKMRDHRAMEQASAGELKNRSWDTIVSQIISFGEGLMNTKNNKV